MMVTEGGVGADTYGLSCKQRSQHGHMRLPEPAYPLVVMAIVVIKGDARQQAYIDGKVLG